MCTYILTGIMVIAYITCSLSPAWWMNTSHNFYTIFTQEGNFETSYLLLCTPKTFQKGVSPQKKEFQLEEQTLSLEN